MQRRPIRTSAEGKCRVSFYEDGSFSDERRWGSLRGDDNCSLAGEAFDVEIDPRVPAADLSPSEAKERGELIETLNMGGSEYAVLAPTATDTAVHGGQSHVSVRNSPMPVSRPGSCRDTGRTRSYRWYVPRRALTICYRVNRRIVRETYDYAVSFKVSTIYNDYVGDAAPEDSDSLADSIDSALPHDGSPVKLGESHYAADSPQTLVNRVTATIERDR